MHDEVESGRPGVFDGCRPLAAAPGLASALAAPTSFILPWAVKVAHSPTIYNISKFALSLQLQTCERLPDESPAPIAVTGAFLFSSRNSQCPQLHISVLRSAESRPHKPNSHSYRSTTSRRHLQACYLRRYTTATMAPQAGVNGVLPVSVLQKNAPTSTPRGPKAAQPRLKLVLRRLPPGLTKTEFESLLGDEWKLGAGKVDWMVYKKGKISKE